MDIGGLWLGWAALLYGVPLAFIAIGWWAGRGSGTDRPVRLLAGLPPQLRVPLTVAGGFIAAVVVALILDQGSDGTPVTTSPPPTRASLHAASAGLLQTAPRWTPTPRGDRHAKPRHRRRSLRPSEWVAASAPVFEPNTDGYLDQLSEEAATVTARQNEHVWEMLQASADADATRSAETLDRMHQETAVEVQTWCEPWCLDSPRDDYP